MRSFFSLITLLLFVETNAQDSATLKNSNVVNNTESSILRAANANQGSSTFFVNPKREIKGSIHLFKDWENRGVLMTDQGDKFKIQNVNINLKNQTFESKFHRDSIFTFSFSDLDRFVINNKTYKNYYYDEDNRIYEIIFESEKFSILKGYRLELVEGSANPMLNRKNDKYLTKDNYYLIADDAIKPFKLRKKRILRLIGGDQSKLESVQKYAKDNSLSYKNEFEVGKILSFGLSN